MLLLRRGGYGCGRAANRVVVEVVRAALGRRRRQHAHGFRWSRRAELQLVLGDVPILHLRRDFVELRRHLLDLRLHFRDLLVALVVAAVAETFALADDLVQLRRHLVHLGLHLGHLAVVLAVYRRDEVVVRLRRCGSGRSRGCFCDRPLLDVGAFAGALPLVRFLIAFGLVSSVRRFVMVIVVFILAAIAAAFTPLSRRRRVRLGVGQERLEDGRTGPLHHPPPFHLFASLALAFIVVCAAGADAVPPALIGRPQGGQRSVAIGEGK
mmetsp:Transcript_38799/g.116654  ORF Transcript_38799/g.116654 Transcript_38799/m.116654 type:complete len:267 (+) Transcript_38799:2446-3246(+)